MGTIENPIAPPIPPVCGDCQKRPAVTTDGQLCLICLRSRIRKLTPIESEGRRPIVEDDKPDADEFLSRIFLEQAVRAMEDAPAVMEVCE